MSFFRLLVLLLPTLLPFLTIHVHSLPEASYYNSTNPKPDTEKGHLPQIFPKSSTPSTPRTLFWDSSFQVNEGKVVSVFDISTGLLVYNITRLADKRTIQIRNSTNALVLSVKRKRGGLGQIAHYQAEIVTTDFGMEYKVDPKYTRTDRWYMHIQGHDSDVNYQTLIYRRNGTYNTGHIDFEANKTNVAQFQFYYQDQKLLTNLTRPLMSLHILQPTKIPDEQFLGLWALVRIRKKRFGK